MIDVESYIFNAAYDDIAPLCAKNGYRSVQGQVPTVFPAVNLYEMDNRINTELWSNSGSDDYAILTYEAHVFATTKAECRKVAKALDDKLIRMNMTRLSGAYSPNTANSNVFEFVARYRVGVDENGVLYRV